MGSHNSSTGGKVFPGFSCAGNSTSYKSLRMSSSRTLNLRYCDSGRVPGSVFQHDITCKHAKRDKRWSYLLPEMELEYFWNILLSYEQNIIYPLPLMENDHKSSAGPVSWHTFKSLTLVEMKTNLWESQFFSLLHCKVLCWDKELLLLCSVDFLHCISEYFCISSYVWFFFGTMYMFCCISV